MLIRYDNFEFTYDKYLFLLTNGLDTQVWIKMIRRDLNFVFENRNNVRIV